MKGLISVNKKTILLSIALGFSFQQSAAAYTPQSLDELESRTDQAFADLDKEGSPGCSVGIQKDGKTLLVKGYGNADISAGTKIGADTYFNIASMSKQFTVLSILDLQAQGLLSVDDDIRTYLPEMPVASKPVRIRHLIHHTSGLADYFMHFALTGMRDFKSLDRGTALKRMLDQDVVLYPAGEKWSYNNGGYLLLSEIVARVSGEPFETFAQKHVLTAAGMNHSYFRSTDEPDFGPVAKGYVPADGGFLENSGTVSYSGDGGLITTMTEFLSYTKDMYQKQSLWVPENENFLTKAAVITPAGGSAKTTEYGGGLGVETFLGVPVITHSGGIAGYNSDFLYAPELSLAIAAFCNVSPANLATRFVDIAKLFLGDMPDEAAPAPHIAAANKQPFSLLTEAEMQALLGRYYSDKLQTYYSFEKTPAGLAVEVMSNNISVPHRDVFAQIPVIGGKVIPLGRTGASLLLLETTGEHVQSFKIRHPNLPDHEFRRVAP